MRHIAYGILFMLAVFMAGCTTPKNIAYFQNAVDIRGMSLQAEKPVCLRPNDKVNIIINSADPMLMQQFNLTSTTSNSQILGATVKPQMIAGELTASGTGLILPYTVDNQGDIDFPVLGKVAVQGLTRKELAAYLHERLIARDLIRDPIVTVEYVNLSVKVLGEVTHPGRVNIRHDSYTILDAIADAGDLTINGQREDIKVMREVDGEDQTYVINLCDRQQMLSSPAFYLQQDDVVYVTPNRKRQREAHSVGNTLNQPAIYISLASLVATIIAILVR